MCHLLLQDAGFSGDVAYELAPDGMLVTVMGFLMRGPNLLWAKWPVLLQHRLLLTGRM